MKRVLSLVLVLMLVLTSIVPAFAEEATNSEAGQALYDFGLIAGDGVNLNEDSPLTRAQMTVILARMYGDADIAEAYELPTTLTDAGTDMWYTPWVNYAFATERMIGNGTDMFSPDGFISAKQIKVLMLKALGYTVEWETVDAMALEAGIVVTSADATQVTRGEIFATVRAALDLTAMDAEMTLGSSLELPGYVAPVVVPVVAVEVTAVASISQTLVEVSLKEAITEAPAAADFMVKDSADAAVAVSSVALKASGMTAVLTVAEMTPNTVYTLTHDAVDHKFVAIANETAKPQLTSAVALTNTTVKLTFNENLDENALNIANYAIDGLSILSAEYDVDANGAAVKTEIVLTTATQTSGTIYKVVVTNVTDLVGNMINSDNDEYQFGGLAADAVKPQLSSAVALTNTTIELTFNESVDEATSENIANYAIDGLSVLSAERQTDKAKVVLTTVAQTSGTIYKVVVTNVTDMSANVINSDNDEYQFGGLAPDTTKPTLTSAVATTNMKVKLTFNENVDSATAEVIANYTIAGLTITEAKVQTAKTEVVLTTSAQTSGSIYKVVIVNVTDAAGNVINADNDEYQFGGLAADTTAPTLVSAVAVTSTTVDVTFSEAMDSTTATQAFNYYLGTELAYPTSVVKHATTTDGTMWTLTTKVQETKIYTLDVTGVNDASGNVLSETADEATFGGKGVADTTAPKVVTAVALDSKTLKVTFNEKMDAATLVFGEFTFSVVSGTEGANAIVGATADAAVVATDKMSVTLSFDTEVMTSGVVYKVVASTNVDDANGNAIVAAANDSANFAGLASSNAAPTLTSVVALDNQTIKYTFSEKITDNGLVNGSFTFATFAPTITAFVVAEDGMSITAYFTSATLQTAGTVYTARIDATKIEDAAGLVQLTPKTSQTYAEKTFAGINASITGPKIAAVTAVDANTLDITFTKAIELKSTVDNALIASIVRNDGTVFTPATTSLVRVEGEESMVVRVFLGVDNTALEAGQLYKVTLAEAQVIDNNGTVMVAADNNKVFAATSVANAAPKMITAVAEAAGNTILVTFSEKIDTTNLAALGTDFTIDGTTTVTAAALVGTTQVRLTVSAPQTAAQVYEITYVAGNGVMDEAGVANANAAVKVSYVAD